MVTLITMADMAGVDVRWIVEGRTPAGPLLGWKYPEVRRAAKMVGNRPDAAQALAAFLDVLEQRLRFPAKGDQVGAKGQAGPSAPTEAATAQTIEEAQRAAWIPILGRTAAGEPHFWSDKQADAGVTELSELIDRHTKRTDAGTHPAQAEPADTSPDATVQIITLDQAGDDTAEFIALPQIKSQWPNAFAVRIDGESMAPDIRHGDLVVLSPSVSASDGLAAVVKLKGQIGVTCKIYRRSGQEVHLVPLNEQFAPQSFPDEQIAWALRVLGIVRSG